MLPSAVNDNSYATASNSANGSNGSNERTLVDPDSYNKSTSKFFDMIEKKDNAVETLRAAKEELHGCDMIKASIELKNKLTSEKKLPKVGYIAHAFSESFDAFAEECLKKPGGEQIANLFKKISGVLTGELQVVATSLSSEQKVEKTGKKRKQHKIDDDDDASEEKGAEKKAKSSDATESTESKTDVAEKAAKIGKVTKVKDEEPVVCRVPLDVFASVNEETKKRILEISIPDKGATEVDRVALVWAKADDKNTMDLSSTITIYRFSSEVKKYQITIPDGREVFWLLPIVALPHNETSIMWTKPMIISTMIGEKVSGRACRETVTMTFTRKRSGKDEATSDWYLKVQEYNAFLKISHPKNKFKSGSEKHVAFKNCKKHILTSAFEAV